MNFRPYPEWLQENDLAGEIIGGILKLVDEEEYGNEVIDRANAGIGALGGAIFIVEPDHPSSVHLHRALQYIVDRGPEERTNA